MRYILSPLIVVLGVLMMKYTVWITDQTGKIDFAEKYLKFPFAGTYTWWRLMGLVAILLAVLWITGFLDFGSGGVQVSS